MCFSELPAGFTIAGFELVCLNKKPNTKPNKNWKSAFFLHCYFYVYLMAVMIKSDLCMVCSIDSAVDFYKQNFRVLRSVCRSWIMTDLVLCPG